MKNSTGSHPVGSIYSIIALVCLIIAGGCSSLPDVQGLVSHELSSTDQPTKIMGKRGSISSKSSQAIIKRLEKQADGTELLQHQVQLMQAVSDSQLISGNEVTLLIDGKATYAEMFKAIEGAKDHINFETFIFDDDEVGNQFAELLVRKSAQGVQVNLIYDSFGAMNTPASFFERLRDGGILTLEFNPINPVEVKKGADWSLDKRDHRKILVVDGAIAFTGGVNVSDVYSGSSPTRSSSRNREEPWRDTHIRLKGPAVAQLQLLFIDTWEKQKGPVLPSKNYFPVIKQAGNMLVRVVGSTPGEMNRLIFMMYMSAITHAENSIYLTTPYFVPDDQMLRALTDAAARGVDVKILLPAFSDSVLVFHASRYYYSQLLNAGVQLFERRGGMLHAKTAVIDDVWSTVGSSNLDTLSLLKNDEANVVILGRKFADSMLDMFESDLDNSDQINPEEWKERPMGNRLKEWFSTLFSHWL